MKRASALDELDSEKPQAGVIRGILDESQPSLFVENVEFVGFMQESPYGGTFKLP